MYIRTTEELQALCEEAEKFGKLAIDVEFIRENTYVPQLALIQIAVDQTCAIIDPLEVPELKPIFDLLNASHVIKVLHAASQDLEVLFWHSSVPPVRVFDTQVAAAMVGEGDQLAYGRLVERLLGVSLAKGESYTNWLQRPLTQEQLMYALDDVRYLLPIHEILSERLNHLGRTEWVTEEFQKLENLDLYQRDPRTLYRRIRRGRDLSAQALAVLRELAEWRDREARQRNRPPGSILKDEFLVEIARKAPRTLDALQGFRGQPRREIERSGAEIIGLVERGLNVAEADRPRSQRKYRLTRTEELMVKFIDAYLKALCQDKKLSAPSIANRADLEELVYLYRRDKLTTKQCLLLQGWRGDMFGEQLLAVLEGRVSLYLDPSTGQVMSTSRD
ncbi:MAG: ribonuclease D [bacterium]|nr:ribonuclease D [bacterium]